MQMTQRQKILRHLQVYGKITTREAFINYGITRLSARIWDLRHKEGILISGTMKQSVNRFGEPVHYMEYKLVS